MPPGRAKSLATWRPASVAFACCAVPIATVIACASWSMGAGMIEPCNPFVDGCTSISRAVRQLPVLYLFRAIMLPCSVLLALYWWQERERLATLAPSRPVLRELACALGLLGSALLIAYVVFLGTDGPVYEFLRRLGIYVFFGGTGIAQAIVTLGLDRAPAGRAERRLRAMRLVLVAAMLGLGPLNLVLKAELADPDAAENVIEWWFAVALFGWFGSMAPTRRRTFQRAARKSATFSRMNSLSSARPASRPTENG